MEPRFSAGRPSAQSDLPVLVLSLLPPLVAVQHSHVGFEADICPKASVPTNLVFTADSYPSSMGN